MSNIQDSLEQFETVEKAKSKKNKKIVRRVALIILISILVIVAIGSIVVFRFLLSGRSIPIIGGADGSTSIAIIGGADGPTAVFVAGKLGSNSDLTLVRNEKENGIAHLPLGMYMEVIEYAGGKVTIEIQNQSGYDMTYGYEYYLDKEENGQWVEMEPVEEYGWEDIAIIIKDLETNAQVCDLNVFGTLEPGKYRLRKNDMDAIFELKQK